MRGSVAGRSGSQVSPVTISDLHHNEAVYAIAIEHGDYRRAARIALRGVRRAKTCATQDKGSQKTWEMRLNACLKRRHS